MNYTFEQKVKIIYGIGALSEISNILNDAGYKKPLVVYDKGIKESGILDSLLSFLKAKEISYAQYDKVVPDPPSAMIDEGGRFCHNENCDCIIAIGGGSTIDTAKGINIVSHHGGNIMDYETKAFGKCQGLISIPTTAGTGSELSQGIIVTDEKNERKVPILAFNSMSEYAILDPELAFQLPAQLTAFTGLDVFSHAAEAYTTINANTMTDLVCEKIMETVVQYLPLTAKPETNIEAREHMCSAAAMSGWMLYNSSAHVGHSLAHVIGNTYHIPHGLTCAYTIPALFHFLAEITPKKVRQMGIALQCEFIGTETSTEIGNIVAAAYIAFRDQLHGMPSIKEYGLSKELILSDMDMLIEKLGKEAFNELSPRKIDASICRQLIATFAGYLS